MSHLYRQLTWTDVREAAAQKKVILIPVAAIEQHGYHLPIDMDFCYEVGHSFVRQGFDRMMYVNGYGSNQMP